MNRRIVSFWKKNGQELLKLINRYYSADYDTIIDEKTKIIHNVLSKKRYTLRSDIVERMEQGDKELIKQTAALFQQENTEEGNQKANLLLQLCQ